MARHARRSIAALAADPDRKRWNEGSVDSFHLSNHYGVTDIDGSRPDAWRYLIGVGEEGKPAVVAAYR